MTLLGDRVTLKSKVFHPQEVLMVVENFFRGCSGASAALLVAFVLVLTACAGSAPGTETPPDSAAVGGQAEPKGAVSADSSRTGGGSPGIAEPPTEESEREWKVDDRGRRYHLRRIPRIKNGYKWLDEEHTRIRYLYGLTYDVVDHDEKTFLVKVYEAEESERPAGTAEETEDEADGSTPAAPVERREVVSVELADLVHFESFGDGLPHSGQWRHGFVLADMDGNGHLDVVHGPPRKGTGLPQIFLGDGEGAWTPWKTDFPTELYDYGDVAVADFDRDGHMDLALAMHLRGVRVLVGDGEGGFTPWSEGLAYDEAKAGDESVFSSRAIHAADWNGDGWMDLVALGEGISAPAFSQLKTSDIPLSPSRGLRLLLNKGDGTWKEIRGEDSDQSLGNSLAIGDFNGDGFVDALTASMSRGWNRVLYLGDGATDWEQMEVDALRPKQLTNAVAAGDLDGDGLDDIVVSFTHRNDEAWRTGVDLLFTRNGDSGLSWERQTLVEIESDRFFVTGLAVGDLTGDGAADLVALTADGQVWPFISVDGGDFVREAGAELPARSRPGCNGYAVRIADLDDDGRGDVVAAFAGEGSGMPGLLAKKGCPGGGALGAWRSTGRSSDR